MMSDPLPLSSPLTSLSGIGSKRAALFSRLGVFCLRDLLTLFPRDYEDRTNIYPLSAPPETGRGCFRLTLASDPQTSRISGGRTVVRARAFDDTGSIQIIFFNRPYIKNQLFRGQEYIFYGKPERGYGGLSLTNPLFEKEGQGRASGRIVPVYPLTEGLNRYVVENAVREALERCPLPPDPLPPGMDRELGLPPRERAFWDIHFPPSLSKARMALKRFAFEELFTFCCAFQRLKAGARTPLKRPLEALPAEDFLSLLPFEATSAQKKAISEAFSDMTSPYRMNRMLQGDVGSGKTAVAAACAWLCAKNGRQAVIMAPTEILARQHQKTFDSLLRPMGIRVGLLVSSMAAGEKRQALELCRSGGLDIICGTHALIQKGVEFYDPALFVIDEQHRFGVGQRSALYKKQPDAHMLVMSATPIPRTLSLIIFGDLDLSVLDSLPKGRQKVQTYCVGRDKRLRALNFLQKAVSEGGQGYIVCPLIEDGESGRASAESYFKELSSYMPSLRLGLLHGRMGALEKERVMELFSKGELDVLVATTVIEVGIDVPNACIMIIENAESFGLSQLHQLRGRVGRGQRESYCILIRNGPRTARLDALCRINDGFLIAEEDLKLRGPGDFFGHRQHGLPEFKAADLSSDMDLFRTALERAQALIKKDPTLSLPENRLLRQEADRLIKDGGGKTN